MTRETSNARLTHTPGPWEVNDSDADYFYVEHVHPGDSPLGQGTETIAALARGFAFGGEAFTVANALLIASAPDLLAERDALREQVETLREACAAIAARKGPIEPPDWDSLEPADDDDPDTAGAFFDFGYDRAAWVSGEIARSALKETEATK